MAEFSSKTMKVRWNNIFKVLKGKKTGKAEFYIQQKYHSRIRAKHRHFQTKKLKKSGHKQSCSTKKQRLKKIWGVKRNYTR